MSPQQDSLRRISAAAELTGEVQKAIYWRRNEPIGDYGYRTAAELVAQGRLDAVLAYLGDLSEGAAG